MKSYLLLLSLFIFSCDNPEEPDTTDVCVDIDGNVYQTVQIGDQLWILENLKVIHYNNGDEIQTGYINIDWADLDETETGAYSVYNDDTSNGDVYGNLYNWYAVDDERGICPEGWHIPSDAEYTVLTDYLGGTFVASGKMKSKGTIEDGDGLWNYWSDEITEETTNESGFTGLPAGYRFTNNGFYYNMGNYGYFWSSSEDIDNYAWYRTLNYNNSYVYRYGHGKQNGYSVRCIKG